MPDAPTVHEVGSATVWFTSQAGITATVLAVVCIALACALVWSMRHCRNEMKAMAAAHSEHMKGCVEDWGKRMDNFRADVKEAFNQNDRIADKVVEALNGVKIEVARMSGRRDRD